MKNSETIFVIQAYGKPEIKAEAWLLLLSWLRLQNGRFARWIVYTDDADFFKRWPEFNFLEFQTLSEQLIKQWRGPADFTHRLKIEMLLHAARHYPEANIWYLDTDTFFIKSLPMDMPNPHIFFMHVSEGRLNGGNYLSRKLARKLKGFKLGADWYLKGTETVFNAGVIGIPAGSASAIEQVLQLSDAMYAAYPKHNIEQLAFSLVLNTAPNLVTETNADIWHYWHLKELRPQLLAFCEYSVGANLGSLAKGININRLIEIQNSKTQWYARHSLMRKLSNWLGNQWQMPQQIFGNKF